MVAKSVCRISRLLRASFLIMMLVALALPASVTLAQKGGEITPIMLDEVVSGTLSAQRYEMVYSYDGQAGEMISVSMVSLDGLDPYLALYDAYPSQNPLAYDDDSGGATDALINGYRLPSTGRYYIVATRYGRETGTSVGGFTLALTSGSVTAPAGVSSGLASFECNGALVDTSAIVNFEDVRPGFTYQVTVIGLDGFDPVIALYAEDGSGLCNDDEMNAAGSMVDVPGIGVVSANGLTAQVVFTTSGAIGDIEMNIGGFGGSGGRFMAIFEGLAIYPAGELDGVTVTTAPVPNGEDMYVYMVSETNALDPYMSLPEWGVVCDDISSAGCMGVPAFTGGGIIIANGGRYVTGPFDAGIGIVSDGTPQYFQFESFAGQSTGNYAMVIMGAAPYVSGTGMISGGTTGDSGPFDFGASPTYGSATLTAGFSPDPYQIAVVSGGNVDASGVLGSPCMGLVASAPDYRLFYTSGQYRLRLFVSSSADTTLVVNAPDGRWYCDDDSGGNLNPLLDFSGPLSGQYDIWVGSFTSGSGQQANLVITETDLTP